VRLGAEDSLVLEIGLAALLVKSCVDDAVVAHQQTASANLQSWANIIPGSPPEQLFQTFPCFSEAESSEISARCRSLRHLRTHENLVLGRVGYKGDYGTRGSGDPMSVVDKNRMMRDNFQPYIDRIMESLSLQLGQPVFTFPYVFLPGFHYQDRDTPNFHHGRDIFFGEFHVDGQHTRLQQQLADVERLHGISHNIDFEQRYTATCSVTVGGMYIYPSQDLSACRRDDPHYSVVYRRGWINLHSGRWVHQISPNRSQEDRICWQAHLVWCDDVDRRGWLIYW